MVAEARRGFIYEYNDGKFNDRRYVLVISNNNRKTDRMVNTIMFGTSNLGHDVVSIYNREIGGLKYLHCGMITYTKREFLVKEVGSITPEELQMVDAMVCRELSVREGIVAERDFYKNAYEELIVKIVSKNIGE
jgi:hypothetical protein